MIAPIVLFVYKRPRHTARTLQALAANPLAAESELIVFSDGPKGANDAEAVAQTRAVIEGIRGFASVRISVQAKNRGLAASVIAGTTEIMESHGRAIVMEDDLITTPHFLSYLNRALDCYRDDPKVFSITGYNFPPSSLRIPSDYPYDTYAAYRSSSWGWGCWLERWRGIDWSMDYYDRFMRSSSGRALFDRGGPDLTAMLRLQARGRIDSWAIRFAYAHHKADMRCIHPVKSLVSNIGLDSSGTHTGASAAHTHDELDENWIPQKFCPGNVVNPHIIAAFHKAATPVRAPLALRVMRKIRKLTGIK